MKIDPRIQSPGEAQSDAVNNAKRGSSRVSASKTDSTGATSSSGDTIQISRRHSEVQRLAAQAANALQLRPERVDPLKTAVQQNRYQPDSGKIADAMLAEHSNRRGKV